MNVKTAALIQLALDRTSDDLSKLAQSPSSVVSEMDSLGGKGQAPSGGATQSRGPIRSALSTAWGGIRRTFGGQGPTPAPASATSDRARSVTNIPDNLSGESASAQARAAAPAPAPSGGGGFANSATAGPLARAPVTGPLPTIHAQADTRGSRVPAGSAVGGQTDPSRMMAPQQGASLPRVSMA